jgi:hypothetical protein
MPVDRPEVGNVLLAHTAINAPVFNDADEQPVRNKLDTGRPIRHRHRGFSGNRCHGVGSPDLAGGRRDPRSGPSTGCWRARRAGAAHRYGAL